MFVGAHERQLDDKGRVALPATYRAHLGEHCYLVKGTDMCVDVIPSEARVIAKEAYVYGFPLVDSYRIQHTYFVDSKAAE